MSTEPRMQLVRTDDRSRVSLGKILEPDRTYRATLHPDGTVVLEPVTAYTREEWEVAFPGIPFAQGVSLTDGGTL